MDYHCGTMNKVIGSEFEEMGVINEAYAGQDLLQVSLLPTMFRTAGSYISNSKAEMIKNNNVPNCQKFHLNKHD